MHAKTFDGGGTFRDEETHEIINVDFLRECFYECAELLEFIQNVETGMITIGLKEYIDLPPVVSVAWRIYKTEIHKIQQREKERMRLLYNR